VVLGSVVVTPLLVGVAATGLLRLLERRTSRALRVWTVVAMAVWAVSFLGPLSATTLGAGLVLATMHLLVGGVVVVGLRLTRAEPTRVA
jgi:predicted NBD/HSP70 family sugar kinase